MLLRTIALSALLLGTYGLASCSGGGGGATGVRASCAGNTGDIQALCLVSCNLGCTSSGCSLNEIAQNQPLIFNFSQALDPLSVTTASISLKTTNGEEPIGQYLVNGSTVTFVPDILLQGGQTFFGFRANETYVLTLQGGPNNPSSLRSTSGDTLQNRIVCNLTVSRGIIDLDQSPPRGSLVVPNMLTNVARTTPIVVEFSEIIDQTSFINSTPANSPMRVRLRRTLPGANGPECNPAAEATLLPGSWRLVNDTARGRTVATFTNTIELPSSICVQVEITNSIRDLAGIPATPQTFQFVTAEATQVLQSRVESFDNDLQLERASSSGTWSGGQAVPGQIGGSGVMGDFDVRFGREVSANRYEWNVQDLLIPASATLTGEGIRVTDGVFQFATMRLGREDTMVLVGDIPARFLVRGSVEIQGKIIASAPNLVEHASASAAGQQGGRGGPGGARGGNGGNKASGTGVQTGFHGQDGQDIRLPAGHAYANRVVGTGGKGSLLFPLDGLNSSIRYSYSNILSMQTSAGGGGGGFMVAGGQGQAVRTHGNAPMDLGPPAAGGVSFDPFPLPAGTLSLAHFLIGGSSGGGAGGNTFYSISGQASTWNSGAGGAGGGGAFAFRVGGDMELGSAALLEARGGSGPRFVPLNSWPSGGGGGSGGSVILQVQGTPIFGSSLGIDVRGGIGGSHESSPQTFNLLARGGDGAPGYQRLEVSGTPSVGLIGVTQPPATTNNVAQLDANDRDLVVGQRSRWYTTNQLFAPNFVRYELEATVGGVPIVFSDDATLGTLATEGAAVRFLIQGANVDENNIPDLNSARPWRRYVGNFATPGENLNDDGRTGFRFMILFDRAIHNEIIVKKLTVFFRA